MKGALLKIFARVRPGYEVCGFLLGHQGVEYAHAVQLLPVRNNRQHPGSFAISRSENHRALRHARSLGLELVALYHTHPEGAGELSTKDRELIRCSDLPWVIITRMKNGDNRTGSLLLTAFNPRSGTPLSVSWSKKE